MEKLKKIFFILFVSIFVGLFGINVKAATTSYKTTVVNSFPSEEKITLKNDGFVNSSGYNSSSGWVTGKPSVYNKHTSSNYALCTNFRRENADSSYTCKIDNSGWSNDKAVSAGVAAIILKASGGINKDLAAANYFKAELAINYFLANNSAKNSSNGKKYGTSENNIGVLATKDIINLAGAGTDVATKILNFNKNKVSVKVGTLKNIDSNQYEATVTRTGIKDANVDYEVSVTQEGNNNIQATYNGKKITISNVNKSGKKIKVTIKFKYSYDYYLAKNYICNGTKNQSMTLNKLKKETAIFNVSASQAIDTTPESSSGGQESGSKIEKCAINFYKEDLNGSPLEGSEFGFTIAGLVQSSYMLDSYSSDDVKNKACFPMEIEGIQNLSSFTEKKAPIGYKKDFKMYDNTTGEEKEITNNKIEADYDNPKDVIIKDAPDTHLIVRKIDGDSKKILAGATLGLYHNGEIQKWDYTTVDGKSADDNGNKYAKISENGTQTTWTTTATEGINFVELSYDEEYSIVEEKAPEGYIINNNTTTVTLKNTDTERSQIIDAIDYASSVKFSKQDITTKKELPGAKLKIIDGQGNVYAEWTSTNQPYEIKTLADGSYYLSETTAPEGYELNTETIPFVVENGKAKSTVVMYNTPNKVIVADTLLKNRLITYVIGGMLIALGTGVLCYEFKKKKHS